MSCCPEQIWYVVCREKRYYCKAYPPEMRTVDEDRELGSNFRMFWFAVDRSCEMDLQYDLFRLNCALLTLAVNRIPPNMLECGFLYELDVEIDRAGFVDAVLQQEAKLAGIRGALEAENDFLYKRDKGKEYPDQSINQRYVLKKKDREGKKHPESIWRKDLKKPFELQRKLDVNKRYMKERLYFPKGILNKEEKELDRLLEKRNRADGFLNEAGLDLLQREKWSSLEEMSNKKRIKIDSGTFERNFLEKEYTVSKRANKEARQLMQWRILPALFLVEAAMFFPFAEAFTKKANMVGWKSRTLFIVLVIAILSAVFWGLSSLIYFIRDRLALSGYNNLIKESDKTRGDKWKYFEEMMNSILEYRYCIHLEKEQREEEIRLREDRERLRRHRIILENSEAICQQLKHLLADEEIKYYKKSIVPIDFAKEPQEIEYYWIPYQGSNRRAELNGTGYLVKVMLSFITKVSIKKTLLDDK